MSRPVQPPHLVRDSSGRPRLKITAGRAAGFGTGAYAQWFGAGNRRTSRSGTLVNVRSREGFTRTTWDFPDQVPDSSHVGSPVDLAAALQILEQSNLFRSHLEAVQRDGWTIAVARPGDAPGCRKGPDEIILDATPRSAFVASIVRSISLARALQQPLPTLEVHGYGVDFVRQNAIFLLRADAASRLDTALVRDELLGRGVLDIGGPSLRGSQIAAYYQHVEGRFTREEAITAIASSADGVEGATFRTGQGPRAAGDLARAFLFGGAPTAPPLAAEIVEVTRRVRVLRALDVVTTASALGVKFVESGANPFFVTYVGEATGTFFTRAELRVSRPGASVPSRLVCIPGTHRPGMTMASFRNFFGRGVPHHLELGERPQATVAVRVDAQTVYVTYTLPGRGQEERVTALTFAGEGAAAVPWPGRETHVVSPPAPSRRRPL